MTHAMWNQGGNSSGNRLSSSCKYHPQCIFSKDFSLNNHNPYILTFFFFLQYYLFLIANIRTILNMNFSRIRTSPRVSLQTCIFKGTWRVTVGIKLPGPINAPTNSLATSYLEPLCTKYLTWKHLTRSSLPPPIPRHAMFFFRCLGHEASLQGSCAIEVDKVDSNDP